jgi:hypothetical protein
VDRREHDHLRAARIRKIDGERNAFERSAVSLADVADHSPIAALDEG